MGQTTSSDAAGGPETDLILLDKNNVAQLFKTMALLKLLSVEIKSIMQKLNISTLRDKSVLSASDLTFLLGLSTSKHDNETIDAKFGSCMSLLYELFKVMGNAPFLLDYTRDEGLTVQELVVTSFFLSGRYQKALPSFDLMKLVFIALAYPRTTKASEKDKEKTTEEYAHLETYSVKAIKSQGEDESPEQLARRIRWGSLAPLTNYDDIDVSELTVRASDLVQVLTLLLMVTAVPRMKHDAMQKELLSNIQGQWLEFEKNALVLVRYIDVTIDSHNLESKLVGYDEFTRGGLEPLFVSAYLRLFKEGFLSSTNTAVEDPVEEPPEPETPVSKRRIALPKFEPTKLINPASVAIISNCLASIGSNVSVSTKNLIKLYRGGESGFSIRSLELKIFKWQAPTVFIVSGKRLRAKTASTNIRYQKFVTEFPRFSRDVEENLKEWQDDHDLLTYAVIVTQPWRASNKKNFGDEGTIIIQLSPRFDYFPSVKNPILKGELVYFNNLGFGVGFGNDQPIARNNLRRFVPGDLSLTVEANLEFAVFRHVALGLGSSYYEKSQQASVSGSDYEDRFMITDLEVWGVGSTAELEEQRKQWEWEEKQAQARQAVNIRNLGEERAFLEMVGLVGNNASGGSM